MNDLVTLWAPTLWCIIGVPLLFGVVLQTYFRFSITKGESMPFRSPRGRELWILAFGVCLAAGLAGVFLLPIAGTWWKIAAAAIYAVVMSVVLVMVAAWLSLKNGDSI